MASIGGGQNIRGQVPQGPFKTPQQLKMDSLEFGLKQFRESQKFLTEQAQQKQFSDQIMGALKSAGQKGRQEGAQNMAQRLQQAFPGFTPSLSIPLGGGGNLNLSGKGEFSQQNLLSLAQSANKAARKDAPLDINFQAALTAAQTPEAREELIRNKANTFLQQDLKSFNTLRRQQSGQSGQLGQIGGQGRQIGGGQQGKVNPQQLAKLLLSMIQNKTITEEQALQIEKVLSNVGS